MRRWIIHLLFMVLAGVSDLASGQVTIIWSSGPNAVNLTSAGLPMDGAFHFELGVFKGSFVPTEGNAAEWAANWKAAQRTAYFTSSASFSSSITPQNNADPFLVGKQAYVWGFRSNALSGEWILFRAAGWTWPDTNPIPPSPPSYGNWIVADATPVIGTINSTGIPFLMKSAAVSNAAPPSTSYAQWQADELSGEALNGPNDDPDHDGVPNLLEYVFGTPPKTAGPPASTAVALVAGYMQITIPRRIDHPANLKVEVSGDLVNWASGSSQTEVVSDDVSGLVVRDLTAVDAAHPTRFMRLNAVLP